MKPGLDQLRPSRDGKSRASKAIPMNSLGIKVHLDRNVGALESGIVRKRAFHVGYSIVLGLNEKRRRCLRGDVDIRIEREVLVGEREITGIDDQGEIRATANLVRGIDRSIETLIEMGAQRCREMSASRKAKHTDPMWVYMPFNSMGPHEPQHSLRIF
jgi:hypothetical protein